MININDNKTIIIVEFKDKFYNDAFIRFYDKESYIKMIKDRDVKIEDDGNLNEHDLVYFKRKSVSKYEPYCAYTDIIQ